MIGEKLARGGQSGVTMVPFYGGTCYFDLDIRLLPSPTFQTITTTIQKTPISSQREAVAKMVYTMTVPDNYG